MKNIPNESDIIEQRVSDLLSKMTLEEKVGQMSQRPGEDEFFQATRDGRVGSIINPKSLENALVFQKIAVEESRLGIPLLIGRDVIHGYKTIFPIPLGQAASWNPEVARCGNEVAAVEAASDGINWTFAPMMDVTREPRWGRIAEGFGEDPYLASRMAEASVIGFQGSSLSHEHSILSCPKHFAAYGWTEAGVDYNLTQVSDDILHDIILPPFEAAIKAGAGSIMPGFSDVNGVPVTGDDYLLRTVLRDNWGFKGFTISDWASMPQMITQGFAKDREEAAEISIEAGMDMEMATTLYEDHLKEFVESGKVDVALVDEAVRNILRMKFALGLFENPYSTSFEYPAILNDDHLQVSYKSAAESTVLLKNDKQTLPIAPSIRKIALLGPLADAPHEQMGTWVFDGEKKNSVTLKHAFEEYAKSNDIEFRFESILEISRDKSTKNFGKATELAEWADVVVLALGEESILSGEAKCLVDLNLQGAQVALAAELAKSGTPIAGIVMAGRPLVLGPVLENLDALLFSFHPGTMGGPALLDTLLGKVNPSGKLPVTFPRSVGQIPIYYNHRESARPFDPDNWDTIETIPPESSQNSLGFLSSYLDCEVTPQFPFGFGMSYSLFEYGDIQLSSDTIGFGEPLTILVSVANTSKVDGQEVVQLYVRDLFGSRGRPVRELKGFQKIELAAGETRTVEFTISSDDLKFYRRNGEVAAEAGDFQLGVGGSSAVELTKSFALIG